MGKLIILLPALLLVVTLQTPASAQAQPKITEDVLTELQELESRFISGGGEHPLQFDPDSARQAGFQQATVDLAQELVLLVNSILEDARLDTQDKATSLEGYSLRQMRPVDLKREFPLVDDLFVQSVELAKQTEVAQSRDKPATSRTAWYDTVYTVCGSFAVPQPMSAAPAQSRKVTGDRSKWMSSNGYHITPTRYFGGGWTRPRTYRPAYCYWGSFRDHAWFGTASNVIMEQNYQYYVPNGEPNPEIYSYIWPYATWPVYVLWWHRTR